MVAECGHLSGRTCSGPPTHYYPVLGEPGSTPAQFIYPVYLHVTTPNAGQVSPATPCHTIEVGGVGSALYGAMGSVHQVTPTYRTPLRGKGKEVAVVSPSPICASPSPLSPAGVPQFTQTLANPTTSTSY
ncbi:hypothetical protein FRB93_011025 [Tulasnella sp. JGI-2019a]|nr:hypothetical protein FRB93_011025 [Tulasnella sp. JGI-2019a]